MADEDIFAEDDFLNLDLDQAMKDGYDLLDDPLVMAERVFQIWGKWADFHLYVTSPIIPPINPPHVIQPAMIEDGEYEFVYPIVDSGYKLSTSKALEMYSAGSSMCKLYYTIEKMIVLLIERLRSSGTDAETEVQVAFEGYLLTQRKAFESIINLPDNVVVTNFEPGEWGKQYLDTVKLLADKGFGYPAESPRDTYKKSHRSAPPKMG